RDAPPWVGGLEDVLPGTAPQEELGHVERDGEQERPERDRGDRVEERLAGVEKAPYVVHDLKIAELSAATSHRWRATFSADSPDRYGRAHFARRSANGALPAS